VAAALHSDFSHRFEVIGSGDTTSPQFTAEGAHVHVSLAWQCPIGHYQFSVKHWHIVIFYIPPIAGPIPKWEEAGTLYSYGPPNHNESGVKGQGTVYIRDALKQEFRIYTSSACRYEMTFYW